MIQFSVTRSLVVGAALLAVGCGSGMTDTGLTTQLLSVSPRGGATGVSTTPDMVFSFTQPMMSGMEQYLALHQGGLTGPTMPMSCNWSDSQKTLTCRPTQALTSVSAYTMHLGGGMMDAGGQAVGMGGHGMEMGGTWAMSGMMGGQQGMMGTGWMDGHGSYGMAFGFTTR